MTTLPSFIELMATIGLDNHAVLPENSPRSSSHSRSPSPRVFAESSMAHQAHRSQSISSFRDIETNGRSGTNRQRIARYSPYSSSSSHSRQRSLSSIAGDEAEFEKQSQLLSTSPPSFSQSAGRRRVLPWLESIPVHSDDLAPSFDHTADTPISSYVRRKTPQTSPISPTFPRYSFHGSKHKSSVTSSPPTVPISLPTLPTIYSDSVTSFSLPSSDTGSEQGSSTRSSPFYSSNPLPEIIAEKESIPRRHTGLRLSAPKSMDFSEHQRSRHIPPV